MELIRPTLDNVPGFVDALLRGWSPNHTRATAGLEELGRVRANPRAYLEDFEDRDAKGPPLLLPDGSTVPAVCSIRRWLWDGEFCGVIGLRWQRGTVSLPPQILGHIGYAVVPWKQGLGYASQALSQMLPVAKGEGLPYVELTTDPDNTASLRVIERCGGVFVERFVRHPAYGSTEAVRYRIMLS